MAQKRFLTASEVFQLFGVDASGLEKLIESGDIEALQDQNTFRYRSEDFAKLVKAGKLKPRASAEMFQIDDEGDDVPFMDLKDEDKAIKFDEDMLFLELDEKALAEQAAKPGTPDKTPVVPDQWFDDTEVSIDVPQSKSGKGGKTNEATDFEMKQKPVDLSASDSDVRLFADDEINLDPADAPHWGSDSDVRLVGPVTASESSHIRKQKKKGSDSDVTLVKPTAGPPQSDSDVVLVGSPTDKAAPPIQKRPAVKLEDSDSDVRLSKPSDIDLGKGPEIIRVEDAADDLLAGDSNIRFEHSDEFQVVAEPEQEVAASEPTTPASSNEIDITLEASEPEIEVVAEANEDEEAKDISQSSIEIVLDDEEIEEPVMMAEAVASDDEIAVVADEASDEITLEADEVTASPDSDVTFEDQKAPAAVEIGSDYGSGIVLEQDSADSGVHLEQTDSGVRIISKKDSDIVLSDADSDVAPASEEIEVAEISEDSAINLLNEAEVVEDGSGIHLEADEGSDSGISLEDADSGISLLGPDSGITLETPDSGIALGDEDSGITLEGDSGISLTGTDSGIRLDINDDSNATFAETGSKKTRPSDFDGTTTDQMKLSGELEDSAFDVNIDNTMEIDTDDSTSTAATVAYKGPSKKSSNKQLALSEAFQLDQPLEVEDLDISDDLDAAGDDFASADSVEFVEAGDEVLDVSDEAFSAAEVPVDVDEEDQKVKKAAPVAKKKTGPTEPAWGALNVSVIACAALVMLATATVLWGGLATMWTGQELPGPAGAVASMLGNLL